MKEQGSTLVSTGKQQCVHLFSIQNNEVHVVHAVQLVQFYIVYTHNIHLIMPQWFCDNYCIIISVVSCIIFCYYFFLFLLLYLLLLIVALTHDFLHVVFLIIYIIVIHHFKNTVFSCCLSHNFYIVSVVKLVVCKLCLN